MKRSVYLSCHCRACRASWQYRSSISKAHKRAAHRAFRRQGRLDPGNIVPVSTGYVS